MSFPDRPLSSLGTGFADQAVDVRRYFDALRRGAWTIGTIVIIFTVAVVAIARALPKSYQASAQIVYNPTTTVLQPTDANSTQRQLATYQALVQTPAVLSAAARSLSEPYTTLKSHVSSTADPNANLVTITASADSARLGAARANAVAQAFLAAEQSAQNRGLQLARVQLQSQIARLRGTPGTAGQIGALQDRISALQINAAGTASQLQIAQTATRPTSASSPRPVLDGVIALFVSLLVAVLVVLGRDQLRPRFGSPRELGRALELPVLAGVPYRRRLGSARRRRALSGLEHEAYDALQATVRLLGRREGGQRVVLVTSATHGEGKTTVTASLGRSLARTGQRTLLISGDVRSPTLHSHFGLPVGPGLTDCLAELQSDSGHPDDAVEDMILAAPGELELDVLPAGEAPVDPTSLMSAPALSVLIETVRRMDYGYVLFDSPPILGLGDSQFLARQADDVLLVARLDRVTPDQAEDVKELLARLKLTPVGLVAVGARVELSPYYLADRALTSQP
jgi:succinoglycan biosynthesis transport protein ExoP